MVDAQSPRWQCQTLAAAKKSIVGPLAAAENTGARGL